MRDRDMGDDALILPPRANPRRMFFGNDTEPQETRKQEVRLPTAESRHGELLMLGFEVAQSTVSKYMVRGGTPPSHPGVAAQSLPSVTRRSAVCWWPQASARMDEIETTCAPRG
jgi:hypothetical protein